MKSKAERLLVVESEDALREQIVAVLSDAGYEVSADYREGMKATHSILTQLSWALILPSSIVATFSPKSKVRSTLSTYAF